VRSSIEAQAGPAPEVRPDAEPVAQPVVERPVTLHGSAFAAWLLGRLGWRLQFDGLPGPQGVAVVYPHTSNWDFPLLVLAKWAVGVPVTFWGKASLFAWPVFGRWLRWLGGRPVLRHTPQGAVGQMIVDMNESVAQGRFMWLALSPEGTRRLTDGWRTGFYRVAHACRVPVGLVALDFGARRVVFDSFWRVSGNLEADLGLFAQRLAGTRGWRPEWAAPVRALSRLEP